MPVLMVAALLAVIGGWGHWRRQVLAARPDAGTLRIGLVQVDVDQRARWHPAHATALLTRYLDATRATLPAQPAVVVWPETAVPFAFASDPRGARVERSVQATGVPLLFGSIAVRRTPAQHVERLNRVYLLSPDGTAPAWYDKRRLVPFGEWVPLRLPGVRPLVAAAEGLTPGTAPTVLRLPAAGLGVLVCYEALFADLARSLVARGAEVLVNVTNDAWFAGTAAPQQLLAQATFRAIESRVPLVRVASTGVSAVVAADGRIVWRATPAEATWHVATVRWPGMRTLVGRLGEWFAALCMVASAGVLVALGVVRA